MRRPPTRLPHQQQLLWNRGVAFAAPKAPEHVDTGLSHQGFSDQFVRQQSCIAHVRFGSKADIVKSLDDVRFTPESGRQLSALGCPLSAKSALMHRSIRNILLGQSHRD
jgi:hypothetical protein